MSESRPLERPILDERDFAFLCDLISRVTGIQLSAQKKPLVAGRLARRLKHHSLRDYGPYIAMLRSAKPGDAELRELINAVTTNKTSFFREEHHFRYLRDEVLGRASGRPIRIWCAGSSTGEEPYSIAMCARDAGASVEILASDIDTNVLTVARAGIYREDRLIDLPSDVVRRHFQRCGGPRAREFSVCPELQRMVEFRQINLVEDDWPLGPPFDVIFCRNVIIYFSRETQDRLFQRFANRLAPGGSMIIGHSENLFRLTDLYEPLGRTVYRRTRLPHVGCDGHGLGSDQGHHDRPA